MRARNIKPGFFKNEELSEVSSDARLLFIGLWCLADREGRLEDRPRRIRAELFPFDNVEVDSMLIELQSKGFIIRYEVDNKKYLAVVNFVKHQDPHYKEKASEIPAPDGHSNQIKAVGVTRSQRERILERDNYSCQHCGAKSHLSIDHILPVSRGGTSEDENLQVLCMSCNTSKGNKLKGETRQVKKNNKSGHVQEFGSNSIQGRINVKLKQSHNDTLITDSLTSDSPIPDILTIDVKPKKYGDFQNVKLSDDEYQKLIEQFGESGTAEKITNLSLYLKSKGDKYKSHYATILSWSRKDGKKEQAGYHPTFAQKEWENTMQAAREFAGEDR